MRKRMIRHRKQRTDDGKGFRRLVAGRRFRLPPDISSHEAERRFARIEDLWHDNEAFCHKTGRSAEWTRIALWAADFLRRGEMHVPFPPIEDILRSYESRAQWCSSMNGTFGRHRYKDEDYPKTVDQMCWVDADVLHGVLSRNFPSVNWTLPVPHVEQIIKSYEDDAQSLLERVARVRNQAPPDPSVPLIAGTLHEALAAYEEVRRKDFILPDGSFDGSGHHMLGMVSRMRTRLADLPLATLDLARCQELIDFWRNRPLSLEKNQPLSKKTAQNYIGELKRFFTWLHLTNQFGWRRPQDLDLLNTKVRDLPSDRRSLDEMEVTVFSVDELALLYKHAIPSERLLLVWGLNCAHGAAEFGRVEWTDLFLRQEHPWRKQGLVLETSEADSWCGFVRPKSGVVGWWWLWPETVRLLDWWRALCEKKLRRGVEPNGRVLITETGAPLYRDESRNAQTGFANAWTRLLDRVQANEGQNSIRRLPFGTLRDQLPDWLGGEQAKAVVASVALCHGIPHRGDKLLYRHYANRPWAALFEAQRNYRQHVEKMFLAASALTLADEPSEDLFAA